MGKAAVEKATGKLREWCRYGTPAAYDAALHNLLDQEEPPPDGTRWDGASWVALPPKTDQEKDSEMAAYLDTIGGKVTKAIVTVLIQKGLCTLAEIRAAYRSL